MSADVKAPPPQGIGLMLFGLIFGQICLHSCMSGLRMATPLQALHDGYGASAVGVLVGLFAAAAVALALPAGKLADRYGSRKPALVAIAMAFIGGLICTVWQSYIALCFTALFTGAAANIGMITIQRSASTMAQTPGDLRRVFGWLGMAPALSSFVGPLTAGFLIDHTGFRGAFMAMTVLPLLGLIAVRFLKNEAPSVRAPLTEPASSGTWALLGSSRMRRLLLVNWLLSACWDVHGFVVPILGFERGLSASAIGTILGVFAFSVGVVRVLLPMFGSSISDQRILSSAMVSAAVVLCVYPFVSGLWAMASCSIALGLVLGGSQPVIMSTLHQITPDGRHGESIALRSLTLNLSSTAMPLIFGAVGTAVGAASLFWLMGVAIGAGSVSARGVTGTPR